MNGVIRWEDPPQAGNSGRKNGPRRTEFWRAVAEQLREHPGRWALVCDGERWNYAGGVAGQIINGRITAFRPAGHFEATTRSTIGDFQVYARYVGGPS